MGNLWGLRDLAVHALVPALACFAVLGAAWIRSRLRAADENRQWMLLVAVGIALIPSALLSRVKHDGDINNYSLFLYFFALAASLGLNSLLVPIWSGTSPSKVVRLAAQAALGVLAAGGLAAAYDQAANTVWSRPSPIALAADLERAHANGIYFPNQPLVMLRIDGRLYHDPDALAEWKVAGFELPLARTAADLPHEQRTHRDARLRVARGYLGAVTPIAAPPGPVYDLKFFAPASPPPR